MSRCSIPADRQFQQAGGRSDLLFALIFLAGLATGCSRAPSRVPAPDWDPAAMAEQAMADLDSDGDGKLSQQELASAPGLKYCSKLLDDQGDGDGSLSRDEIAARLSEYEKMRVGLTNFGCQVMFDRRPLTGATVRLVPELFLAGAVEPLEGTSKKGGRVEFYPDQSIPMSLARVCMYRVEITSPEVEIPEMYNVNTILGVEVSAMTDPYHAAPVVFQLQK